jgi:tetratricopeptide (TPR) repeat protein
VAVTGSYFDAGDSLEFHIRVVDPAGQVRASVDPIAVHKTNPRQGLDELQCRATSAVAGVVAPGSKLARINQRSHFPTIEALDRYEEARRAKFTEGPAAAIPLLVEAMEADPDYFAPLILLIWEYNDLEQWRLADSLCVSAEARAGEMERFDRLDMEGGCANTRGDYTTLLRKARLFREEFYPNAYQDVGFALLRLNRPGEAVEAFLDKDPRASWEDWNFMYATWFRLSQAYHLVGEYGKELDAARQLEEHFPEYEMRFHPRLSALAAMGRLDEFEEAVDDVFEAYPPPNIKLIQILYGAAAGEAVVHGHPEAAGRLWERSLERYHASTDPTAAYGGDLWLWATALLETGHPDEAQALLEPLQPQLPNYAGLHGFLGVAAARQGDRATAERYLQRLADLDGPYDRGDPEIQAASIHANLGDLDRAVELLEKAVTDGFGDWIELHNDPFLEPLRGYPPFEEFIRPKG